MEDVIGKIEPSIPLLLTQAVDPTTGQLTGITGFLNTILRIIFVVAGVWALINIILAGVGYIGAGGDPKKVSAAWAKIWQSFVGLLIIVSSFLIAAIIGMLLFRDPAAILQPKI